MISIQDQAKVVPTGKGQAYWGPGNKLTFLVTGEETGGAFFMAEGLVLPGGGPPPHIHSREDESFYMLEGTLTVQVGDQTLQASPGDFVYLPRGIAHTFRNTGNENARMLVTATPAGLEKYFEETFDPAVEGSGPPPLTEALIKRAIIAAPQYGLKLLLPARKPDTV
jgi:quercetin dioxygenase-like cupin family protein